MKLKTLGLALVATAFMASSAMAAMDPIPNPPEKPKPMHHKKHHMAKKTAAAADAKADAKAPADAKPAMPAKK